MGVLAPVLPQNEVYGTTPPQNEVYRIALPCNEVYGCVLPQNGVFKIVLLQVKVNRTVLSQTVVKMDGVNCQLSDRVKFIFNFGLNLGVRSFNLLISTLIHGGENLGWTIRILLESLQHVLKMYTWSLSEIKLPFSLDADLLNYC